MNDEMISERNVISECVSEVHCNCLVKTALVHRKEASVKMGIHTIMHNYFAFCSLETR